jgi:methionine-rich copper-binding protein CopC
MKVMMIRPQRVAYVALVVAMTVLFPQSALAHNVVIDQRPEPNSVITQSPVMISITTNDALLDLGGEGKGFVIAVVDEAGLYYGDGCLDVQQATLSAVVELGEAGTYTVIYQYVSADGHSLSDQYTFVFTPEPAHQPARGTSELPQCGVVASEDATAPTDMPAGSPEEIDHAAIMLVSEAPEKQDANPWLIVMGFGVAALAGYALVQFFRRGPRQKST